MPTVDIPSSEREREHSKPRANHTTHLTPHMCTRNSKILEKGLQSPGGHAHHYLPSFLGKAYADRVLAHARAMHDHHKAEQLRAALMGCLMKLSI